MKDSIKLLDLLTSPVEPTSCLCHPAEAGTPGTVGRGYWTERRVTWKFPPASFFPLCLPGTDSLTDPPGRRQAVGEISRGCDQPKVKDGKCPPPMMKQAGRNASPGKVSASKPHPPHRHLRRTPF